MIQSINGSECIFLQSLLKSRCLQQHFIGDASPLTGRNQTISFQELLEGQSGTAIEHAAPITPTIHQTKTTSKTIPATQTDNFVRSIWPFAKLAAASIGLDPKVLVAQAALETGWGKGVVKDAQGVSSNNFFNIKAPLSFSGASIQIRTTEYQGNRPIKMNEAFKRYASIADCFNDYISLIKDHARYQKARAYVSDAKNYVQALHQAGYATDPHYSDKILSIYHGEVLREALLRII
jgi:peptidoglycan hydrolase FlgJ